MSDMYRRAGASQFLDKQALMRAWLGVLISGSIALAVFAIPLKSSRAGGGTETIHSLVRRLSTDHGKAVDFDQASIRLVGLGESFGWTDPTIYFGADGQIITVERIRRFLARQGSPMTRYARAIVLAGIRYHVDPRVPVAISGVESGYGKHQRGHNAWGWGGGRTHWATWEIAIDRYTAGISSRYRSLRTGKFARVSRTYCPPCGSGWGRKAQGIFNTI